MHTEQTPTVAGHHLFGAFNGFAGSQFRIFCQYVACHGVAIGCDNTWNDEQQRPQQNIDTLEKSGAGSRLPKLEIAEHGAYLGFFLPIHQIQIELHIADLYDTAKNKQRNADDNSNNCKIYRNSSKEDKEKYKQKDCCEAIGVRFLTAQNRHKTVTGRKSLHNLLFLCKIPL